MPEYEVARLSPEHGVRGLSLGAEEFTPLKRFLAKEARNYENFSLARTYVACEQGSSTVRGYVSIVCGEVAAKIETADGVNFPYNYPAIKIARLAVDARHNGAGLGRSLVDLAIGIGKEIICPSVGCRFAVVDAKRTSVPFYKKCGFTLLETEENRNTEHPLMFLDLLRA